MCGKVYMIFSANYEHTSFSFELILLNSSGTADHIYILLTGSTLHSSNQGQVGAHKIRGRKKILLPCFLLILASASCLCHQVMFPRSSCSSLFQQQQLKHRPRLIMSLPRHQHQLTSPL